MKAELRHPWRGLVVCGGRGSFSSFSIPFCVRKSEDEAAVDKLGRVGPQLFEFPIFRFPRLRERARGVLHFDTS